MAASKNSNMKLQLKTGDLLSSVNSFFITLSQYNISFLNHCPSLRVSSHVSARSDESQFEYYFNGHFFFGRLGQGIRSFSLVRLKAVWGKASRVGPLPMTEPAVTKPLAFMPAYLDSSSARRSSRDLVGGSTPSSISYISHLITSVHVWDKW